jgi:phosphatidylserine/phosphatidylglycerophosphate/cardiolipin synthase-like enzyme
MSKTFRRIFNKIKKMLANLSKNALLIGPEFTKGLVDLIDQTERSIYIFMFDWRWYKNDITCDVSLINQALVRATRRGVKVQTLLNYADLEEQLNALNIKAKKANVKKLLHAKSIILDEHVIVLGSHNLTKEAMTANVEMSLVIDDSELAGRIIDYFTNIWSL